MVILVLALVFTFSCSSSGGIYLPKDSQVYKDISSNNDYKTNVILSINAKKGWNTVYKNIISSENGETNEYNTNNILTKELKWTFFSND
jgi:hypothetical protein